MDIMSVHVCLFREAYNFLIVSVTCFGPCNFFCSKDVTGRYSWYHISFVLPVVSLRDYITLG